MCPLRLAALCLKNGMGGVECCWRCVTVKLINLVFISEHHLCLPHSHAPTKRHIRANNYPAMLQTAPPAQCTRPALGADQEAKSRLITSFTSVLTNSPAWPLQATVSIDQTHTSCHTSKAHFVRSCSACQFESSSHMELYLNLQKDGEVTWAKGQNDITCVLNCSVEQVCKNYKKLSALLFHIWINIKFKF